MLVSDMEFKLFIVMETIIAAICLTVIVRLVYLKLNKETVDPVNVKQDFIDAFPEGVYGYHDVMYCVQHERNKHGTLQLAVFTPTGDLGTVITAATLHTPGTELCLNQFRPVGGVDIHSLLLLTKTKDWQHLPPEDKATFFTVANQEKVKLWLKDMEIGIRQNTTLFVHSSC